MLSGNAVRQALSAVGAIMSMVLCAVIFYTMRNEHHENLNAIARMEIAENTNLASIEARTSAAISAIQASVTPVPAAPAPVAPVTELLPFNGLNPATYKTEVSCPTKTDRTMVMVPAGQSNASNSAGAMTRSAFGAKIVNFFHGRCYLAEDPLLGSDGDSGSAWVMLANQLIEAGAYDEIVIAPVAAGGTYMVRWVAGGDLYHLFRKQISLLAENHLAATDIFWVHGEAERDPSSAFQKDNGKPYRIGIEDLLLASQLPAEKPPRFFVGLNSSCPNQFDKTPYAAPIRAAQLAVAENDPNAFLGADIDAINGYADRLSLCHLTAIGLDKYVADWKSKILSARSTSAPMRAGATADTSVKAETTTVTAHSTATQQ